MSLKNQNQQSEQGEEHGLQSELYEHHRLEVEQGQKIMRLLAMGQVKLFPGSRDNLVESVPLKKSEAGTANHAPVPGNKDSSSRLHFNTHASKPFHNRREP